MVDDVEVTQEDRIAAIFLLEEEGEDHMVRQIRTYGEECDHWPQVQAFARHRITSVRAAAMSDLIAGDADLYGTPSARITGDKDRENPVEGAQPAPSDDLVERVARAIHSVKMSGHNPDCLYQHHDYESWPVDDRREYADPFTGEPRVQLFHKAWRHYEAAARAAIAAVGQDTRSQVEREIVAWLRACSLSSAIPDDPAQTIADLAAAIEQGQHRSTQ